MHDHHAIATFHHCLTVCVSLLVLPAIDWKDLYQRLYFLSAYAVQKIQNFRILAILLFLAHRFLLLLFRLSFQGIHKINHDTNHLYQIDLLHWNQYRTIVNPPQTKPFDFPKTIFCLHRRRSCHVLAVRMACVHE